MVTGCGLVGVLALMSGLLLFEVFPQFGARLDVEFGEGGLEERTRCGAKIGLVDEGGILRGCGFDELYKELVVVLEAGSKESGGHFARGVGTEEATCGGEGTEL